MTAIVSAAYNILLISIYIFIYLQIYAPSSSHSIKKYKDFIDYSHVIISMNSQTGLVIVIGDFTAHLQGVWVGEG